MATVERVAGELGTKLQVSIGSEASSSSSSERHLLDGFMERLHNKASQFKSWTENAKAARVALMDKRYVLDAVDRSQLQKCLDVLQKSIKVTSLHSMVERLESISRQLGLKLTAGPSGTDYFINSDMFYVEVLLETTGAVKDVKIAHHGDPVSCLELFEVLKKGDFIEFTKHLEGLSSIYQLNADKKQKSKAYMALQALETDLWTLSQLQCSINDPCNLVHKSPVGILQVRRGGYAMKLTYFISPYDLLDLDSKTLIPLTVETVVEKQLGYSVMICIESSTSHKLQTQSLMSIAKTADGKSLPSFAAPSNLNSTTLPASFVMRLDSPMPLATALVRRIQAITRRCQIDCADLTASQPLLSLIMQQASGGLVDPHGLFVTLPDQQHCYFLNGVVDLQGVMVSSIPFTHPTHVPQILIFLRQQALFNVLIGSCIRPNSRQDIESALMFEVSALSWLHITVAFEHPLEESMATAELDLSDITNVKCKLHTMPNDTPICSDEFASKVMQRCLSIPITMRALIRKNQAQQSTALRPSQISTELPVQLNGGNGSSGSSNGGVQFAETNPKFVADFDVKMNGEPRPPSTETVLKVSPPRSPPVTTTSGDCAATVPTTTVTTTGDLFTVPPERTGSAMTGPSLLGPALAQAVGTGQRQQAQPGKPNVMLMSLLNDVPQAQPMTSSAPVAAKPRLKSQQQLQQRKRKPPSGAAAAAEPSPKTSRPSEDDEASLPEVESESSLDGGSVPTSGAMDCDVAPLIDGSETAESCGDVVGADCLFGAGDDVKVKEGRKLMKKVRSDEVHLGKEIEKIPIVLDIVSGPGTSGADVSSSSAPKTSELGAAAVSVTGSGSGSGGTVVVVERPNVEIIPLGLGTVTTPASTLSASAPNPSNSAVVKIAKPKPKARDVVRRSMSETLNCAKTKVDVTSGRKERKRKRVESVDGVGLDSSSAPPLLKSAFSSAAAAAATTTKVINMMTSSHVTSLMTTTMTSKALEFPPRPLTLSVKPAPASGSPNISVSVAKMPLTTTTSSSVKKPSPTSSPTKPVSILKNTQVTASKPKLPLSKYGLAAPNRITDGGGGGAGTSGKMTSSPFKVQQQTGRGRQVSVKMVAGSNSLTAAAAKLSGATKPATVKLKQLSLAPAVVTSRGLHSPTILKGLTGSSGCVSPVSMTSPTSLVTSPTSPLLPKSLSFTQATLTAAQKASKLFARSRKASLSSVIDKLSMQLQHTGSGEFIAVETVPAQPQPPPPSNIRSSLTSTPPPPGAFKDSAKKEVTSSHYVKSNNTTGSSTTNTGSNANSNNAVAAKNAIGAELIKAGSADILKKAEFTVKPSSQGIKLTVTKTHVTEGTGSKMASAKSGNVVRGGGGAFIKAISGGAGNSAAAAVAAMVAGSSTGLKPGVNSGPASKKAAGSVTTGSSLLSAAPKSSSPTNAPKLLVTSSPKSTPSSPISVTVVTTVTKVVSKPVTTVVSSSKMAAVTPPPTTAPKSIGSAPMGPPPPPPPPQPVTPEFTVQVVKRNDERQSPIRHLPKLPLLEETEAGRAFQRLLQIQNNGGGGGNFGAAKSVLAAQQQPPPPPPNGAGDVIGGETSETAPVKPEQPKDFRSTPEVTGASSPVESPVNSVKSRLSSPISSSSGVKDTGSSPEDGLVIDCPVSPNDNRKLVKVTEQPVTVKSPDVRSPPTAALPVVIKSPVTQGPVTLRSPAVNATHTPQSEHSNPSSVAPSPYDIDDDLMDEALVGLGK